MNLLYTRWTFCFSFHLATLCLVLFFVLSVSSDFPWMQTYHSQSLGKKPRGLSWCQKPTSCSSHTVNESLRWYTLSIICHPLHILPRSWWWFHKTDQADKAHHPDRIKKISSELKIGASIDFMPLTLSNTRHQIMSIIYPFERLWEPTAGTEHCWLVECAHWYMINTGHNDADDVYSVMLADGEFLNSMTLIVEKYVDQCGCMVQFTNLTPLLCKCSSSLKNN